MCLRTWGLRIRMFLVVALMFALFYALIAAVMYFMNINIPIIYVAVAVFIMGFQYILGPKLVDFVMRVRYVDPYENPRLHLSLIHI